MKIIIEDNNKNKLCEMYINTLFELCQIENLIGCNITEVDKDEDGKEYLKVQLNKTNLLIKK